MSHKFASDFQIDTSVSRLLKTPRNAVTWKRTLQTFNKTGEMAFVLFLQHQLKVGDEGGNCHRLIMIFSDGGTDQAQEVMDR